MYKFAYVSNDCLDWLSGDFVRKKFRRPDIAVSRRNDQFGIDRRVGEASLILFFIRYWKACTIKTFNWLKSPDQIAGGNHYNLLWQIRAFHIRNSQSDIQ
jgi:hypothetical protein